MVAWGSLEPRTFGFSHLKIRTPADLTYSPVFFFATSYIMFPPRKIPPFGHCDIIRNYPFTLESPLESFSPDVSSCGVVGVFILQVPFFFFGIFFVWITQEASSAGVL